MILLKKITSLYFTSISIICLSKSLRIERGLYEDKIFTNQSQCGLYGADPSKNISNVCDCKSPKYLFASLDEQNYQCINPEIGMYE